MLRAAIEAPPCRAASSSCFCWQLRRCCPLARRHTAVLLLTPSFGPCCLLLLSCSVFFLPGEEIASWLYSSSEQHCSRCCRGSAVRCPQVLRRHAVAARCAALCCCWLPLPSSSWIFLLARYFFTTDASSAAALFDSRRALALRHCLSRLLAVPSYVPSFPRPAGCLPLAVEWLACCCLEALAHCCAAPACRGRRPLLLGRPQQHAASPAVASG